MLILPGVTWEGLTRSAYSISSGLSESDPLRLVCEEWGWVCHTACKNSISDVLWQRSKSININQFFFKTLNMH
jgi:hypothetical protein